MQSHSEILAQLLRLFEESRFTDVLLVGNKAGVTPEADPIAAHVMASAYFKTDRIVECLDWCQRLVPALDGDKGFMALYGAALRRSSKLSDSQRVLQKALNIWPDDPVILNNLANVFIDQRRLNDALQILEPLVQRKPINLPDIISNLNRARFMIKEASANYPSEHIEVESSSFRIPDFADPLHEAFNENEIVQANMDTNSSLLNTKLPARDLECEYSELLRLARDLVSTDPQKAIEECRLIHSCHGPSPTLYSIAGDAYIRLRLFSDAETSLMSSRLLGNEDISILLNLANLASMRGDFSLSLKWLELASAGDASNENIALMRSKLFPSGVPKLQNPFQINMEQQTPGSIVAS